MTAGISNRDAERWRVDEHGDEGDGIQRLLLRLNSSYRFGSEVLSSSSWWYLTPPFRENENERNDGANENVVMRVELMKTDDHPVMMDGMTWSNERMKWMMKKGRKERHDEDDENNEIQVVNDDDLF